MKMKTLITSAAACIMLAGIVQSQVISKNAAGYVKFNVPAGGLELMCMPFEDFDATPKTVDELFGTSYEANTTLFFFNAASQAYESYSYSIPTFGSPGWLPNGNRPIVRGESFFFKHPAGATTTDVDVYLYGEVPDTAGEPTTTTALVANGLKATGNPYPTSMNLIGPSTGTNPQSPLGTSPNANDTVFAWDSVAQAYITASYSVPTFGSPSWLTSDPAFFQSIPPGRGFFYQNAGAGRNWTETKSYSWP